MAITITSVAGGLWFRGLQEDVKCGMGYSISRDTSVAPPARPQTICLFTDEFGEAFVPLPTKEPGDPATDPIFAVYLGETDVRFRVWSPYLGVDETARTSDADINVAVCGLVPNEGETRDIPAVTSIQTSPGLGEVDTSWMGVQAASQRIPQVSGYLLEYREVLRTSPDNIAIALIDSPSTVSSGVIYDEPNDLGTIAADYSVSDDADISYVKLETTTDGQPKLTLRIDDDSWAPILGTLQNKESVSAAVILPNGATRVFPSTSLTGLTQRQAVWELENSGTYTISSRDIVKRRDQVLHNPDEYRTNTVDRPVPWTSMFSDIGDEAEDQTITTVRFSDRSVSSGLGGSRRTSSFGITLGGVWVPLTQTNRSADYVLEGQYDSLGRYIYGSFSRSDTVRVAGRSGNSKLRDGIDVSVRVRNYEVPFQTFTRSVTMTRRSDLLMLPPSGFVSVERIVPDISGLAHTITGEGRSSIRFVRVTNRNPTNTSDVGRAFFIALSTNLPLTSDLSFTRKGMVTVTVGGRSVTMRMSNADSSLNPFTARYTYYQEFPIDDAALVAFMAAVNDLYDAGGSSRTMDVTVTLDARGDEPYSDWREFTFFPIPGNTGIAVARPPHNQNINGVYQDGAWTRDPPFPVPTFLELADAVLIFGSREFQEVQTQLVVDGLPPDTRWRDADLDDGRFVVMLFPDGTSLDHPWVRVPVSGTSYTVAGLAHGVVWQFRVSSASARDATTNARDTVFTAPRAELPTPTTIVPVGRIDNPIAVLSERNTHTFRSAGIYPPGAMIEWEVVSGVGSFSGGVYDSGDIEALQDVEVGLRVNGVLVATDAFQVYPIRAVEGMISNKIVALLETDTHLFRSTGVFPIIGTRLDWQVQSGSGTINRDVSSDDFGRYTPADVEEDTLVTIALLGNNAVLDTNTFEVLAVHPTPQGTITNKIVSILEDETHDFDSEGVNAPASEVSWLAGGNPVRGTISATGLYTAPTVPETRITANATVDLSVRGQVVDSNLFTVVRNIPPGSEIQYAYLRGETQPALPNPMDQRESAAVPQGWSETALEPNGAEGVYRLGRTIQTFLERFESGTTDWAFDPQVQPWLNPMTSGMIARTQGVADNKMVAHSVGAATMNFSAGDEDKAFTRRNLAIAIGRSTPSDPDDAVTVQVFETAVNEALAEYSISNETVTGRTVTWDAPPGTWPWTYRIATRATAGGAWTDQGSQTARSYTAAAGTVQVRIIPRSASDALTTIVDL